jgi:pimeloyl-ACP methyl ester carboxylesterase
VVLVHGLTDSPFYLAALGGFFHQLGFSVYLPLLQGHGLKDPRGMAGVSLQEWKRNVAFAVEAAAATGDRIAIGGLSTGGALALHAACTDARVAGDIYLFAAALGLYDAGVPILGRLVEGVLRLPILKVIGGGGGRLVGCNPYRYDRVPWHSAGELSRLIAELREILGGYRGERRLARRIFAAWSAADRVVRTAALAELAEIVTPGSWHAFVVPAERNLAHAGVVLAEPIWADGASAGSAPQEEANPLFFEMVAALAKFVAAPSARR